jgi:uncharacterized membrane protein
LSAIAVPSPFVLAHLAAALLALGLGAWNLLAAKGTARHRWVGRAWVGLMLVVALSSFGITGLSAGVLGPGWLGWFSPIHLLSVFVLVAVPRALWAARRGDLAAHRSGMRQAYFLGLLLAGAFTLLPGRLLGRLVFG